MAWFLMLRGQRPLSWRDSPAQKGKDIPVERLTAAVGRADLSRLPALVCTSICQTFDLLVGSQGTRTVTQGHIVLWAPDPHTSWRPSQLTPVHPTWGGGGSRDTSS